MLRDPVFCNSVRGFVAKISHFGPLQARPAARRSKRPVPRTVPAARLPSPTCLRLPSADPRPPSAPPPASPPPTHGSGCLPAVSHMPPAARLPSPTHLRLPSADPRPPPAPPSASPPPRARFRLPACRLPRASGCPPAVSHTPPIAVRRPRPPSAPAARAAVRIAAPAHGSGCPPAVPYTPPITVPPPMPAAHACRPCRRPHRRPAHGSGCPPVASRMPPAAARRPTSAVRAAARIAAPHARFRLSACRPRPPSAPPPASPVAHPAPAVSPSRRPCLPSTCPTHPPPRAALCFGRRSRWPGVVLLKDKRRAKNCFAAVCGCDIIRKRWVIDFGKIQAAGIDPQRRKSQRRICHQKRQHRQCVHRGDRLR